jgi:hypothetical protein
MTPAGGWKAVTRPARRLARSLIKGITVIGLSMHGRSYREAEPVSTPAPIPAPRVAETTPRTGFRDDLISGTHLTPDELLWQAELE